MLSTAKAAGIAIDADADPAFIGGHVVDAIGDGFAQAFNQEVMDANGFGLPLGPQFAPGVLEIADQFFLLGVDGDGGLPVPTEAFDGSIDVLELCVAVGMLAPFAGLGVGLQAEAQILQQAADEVGTDLIALCGEAGGEVSLASADPQQGTLWVATDGGHDQVQQSLA